MNFVRLDENTILNLDSVASVTWTKAGGDLVALVRHLVASPIGRTGEGLLASEKISGDAAQALHRILGGHTEAPRAKTLGNRGPTKKLRAAVPNSSESIYGIVAGLPKKGWYYVTVDEKGYFLAMVNMKGSCSMRTFDAETGRFLGKRYARGNYQDQFRIQLKDSRELTINRQPNLETECKEKLPNSVLSHLRSQISQQA